MTRRAIVGRLARPTRLQTWPPASHSVEITAAAFGDTDPGGIEAISVALWYTPGSIRAGYCCFRQGRAFWISRAAPFPAEKSAAHLACFIRVNSSLDQQARQQEHRIGHHENHRKRGDQHQAHPDDVWECVFNRYSYDLT